MEENTCEKVVNEEEELLGQHVTPFRITIEKSVETLGRIRRQYGTLNQWELVDVGISPVDMWDYVVARWKLRKCKCDIMDNRNE